MFASITGTVDEKGLDYAVLAAGGIGYYMRVPTSTAAALPKTGEKAKLYTYLHVREGAIDLYGFESREQKQMFIKAMGVSGVGPKVALGILSSLSVSDLAVALVTRDISALTRVPGIGKKTAERLVLELREKVDNEEMLSLPKTAAGLPAGDDASEAVQALIALGYQSSEAVRAIEQVRAQADRVEDMILLALRKLDGK
nr:Holliday junction branch migration protein RuvA [Maliibacterium massiliense]